MDVPTDWAGERWKTCDAIKDAPGGDPRKNPRRNPRNSEWKHLGENSYGTICGMGIQKTALNGTKKGHQQILSRAPTNLFGSYILVRKDWGSLQRIFGYFWVSLRVFFMYFGVFFPRFSPGFSKSGAAPCASPREPATEIVRGVGELWWGATARRIRA